MERGSSHIYLLFIGQRKEGQGLLIQYDCHPRPIPSDYIYINCIGIGKNIIRRTFLCSCSAYGEGLQSCICYLQDGGQRGAVRDFEEHYPVLIGQQHQGQVQKNIIQFSLTNSIKGRYRYQENTGTYSVFMNHFYVLYFYTSH